MTYLEAKQVRDALDKVVTETSNALQVFPRGPMGLVTDDAKASTEYRAARVAFDGAFAKLRAFNAGFVKQFTREIRAERSQRFQGA